MLNAVDLPQTAEIGVSSRPAKRECSFILTAPVLDILASSRTSMLCNIQGVVLPFEIQGLIEKRVPYVKRAKLVHLNILVTASYGCVS